ncbi:MAG TPA: hypothetical protein VGB13_04445 [Candidatus Krumholzibacteria bacterium]
MRFLNGALTVGWFVLAFVVGGLLYRSILVSPEVPVIVAGAESVLSAPAGDRLAPSESAPIGEER